MTRGVKNQNNSQGSIRIISGRWRGRKLPVLDAEGLRPTTDRTKETLFNWLMHRVQDSHCLDVFAGSGSLGLEALSRHAASVTFFEVADRTGRQLQHNLDTLSVPAEQALVQIGNSLHLIERCQQKFDLIFIDPPFAKGLIQPTIERIVSNDLLNSEALIYIESERAENTYVAPDMWSCIKQKQTKQVDYRLYQHDG